MGNSHILWIHNDGIREAKNNPEAAAKLEQPLGKAVLKVCLDPYYEAIPEGGKRVNSEAVLNYGNCVCWAGEPHHTDEQIFVWGRNCLRTPDQLDDAELESAKRLLDSVYASRQNKKVGGSSNDPDGGRSDT